MDGILPDTPPNARIAVAARIGSGSSGCDSCDGWGRGRAPPRTAAEEDRHHEQLAHLAQISDRQATIASAVEEQTATTQEMSRSVAEAANGAGQIADNITSVSTAAGSTTPALTQTRSAVDELSRMAAELRSTVGRFTY